MSPDDVNRQMRASDGDRDRVAGILQQAASEGRITLDELGERLDQVYRARTYADLEPITADLPSSGPPSSVPAEAGRVSLAGADTPLVLNAKAGTITRRGAWRVPRRVEIANPYGSVRLNLRDATLLSDLIDLDISVPWGDAKLVLPEGATAEVSVETSWFGNVDSRVPEIPAPPAPHFRITGSAKGGSLKIRYKLRLDDLLSWDDWD